MKIEIPVTIKPEKVLMLTQHIGDGTLGDVKFDCSCSQSFALTFIKIEGVTYQVDLQNIITAVIQMHEKGIPKTPKS